MKIAENISLRHLNSFGVEARAARLVEWETAPELVEVDFSGPWMALGGGNNVLFTRDYAGTLIKSAARRIEITRRTEEQVFVRAEAGVEWDDLVAWCVERGLWGVENLSAIPGTVGAAPIQNIGAYGAEAKDVIVSVECFAVESGTVLTIAREHCEFGYRDSVFKRSLRGKVIVTAVNFALDRVPKPNLGYGALAQKVIEVQTRAPQIFDGPQPPLGGPSTSSSGTRDGVELKTIRQAVIEIRAGKLPDPRETGNAGSFFKNPVVETAVAAELVRRYPTMPQYPAGGGEATCVAGCNSKTKLAAGWLIEQAGWRGKSIGPVGIDPRQALVVVNTGGATGAQIVDFAQQVREDVRAKFGVELETEVNII